MKYLLLLLPFGLMAIGCGREDPRVDPTKQPGFVDTSDPSVLLGQRKAEMEKRKGGATK